MSNKRTPYALMKSAVYKDIYPKPSEFKKINSFFLVRYISNDPSTIHIANILNNITFIPIEAQYKFVYYSTMTNISYINYGKEENKELIKILKYKYKINNNRAKEYVKLLKEEEKKSLIEEYKNFKF